MNESSTEPTRQPAQAESPFPVPRHVGVGAPLCWLRAGVRDLLTAPGSSLFYGFAFALAGWLIYLVFRFAFALAYGLTWGFLLVGPYLATGLYEISRRIEAGEPVSLWPTLTAWRTNIGGFGVFSIVLTVLMLLWSRASLILFALFFSSGLPSVDDLLGQVLRLQHWDFVLAYFAVGALFGLIGFCISVVSVPLILDRRTDAIVAAITSVRTIYQNPAALLLWALLILGLICAGLATRLLGLVIVAPVLGHATWHAYRDLLEGDPNA